MSQQQDNLTEQQIAEVIEILDKGEFLSAEQQERIGNAIAALHEFMKNKAEAVEKSENLEAISEELNKLWLESRASIEEAAYSLPLDNDEYKFVINLLETAEFSSTDDLFTAEEVDETILAQHRHPKLPLKENLVFTLDIKQLTKFYHVLTLHKAKGLYKASTTTFSNLMKKTGKISIIFSYFNSLSRELSPKVYQFSLGLNPKPEATDGEDISVEQ